MTTPALHPYGEWLGVRVARDEAGAPLFSLGFSERTLGRPGFFHGGAIGGLLEIAAFGTLLDRMGEGMTASDLKPITVSVDYMRGAREQDIHAAATIVRLGKRIATVEARAWQDDPDRIVASARMTLLLRPRPGEGS